MPIRDLMPWNWGKKHGENDNAHRDESQALTTLRTDMNRLFHDFFHNFNGDNGISPFSGNSLFSGGLFSHEPGPTIDVSETDSEIEITAELPGMTEDDIDVSFRDNVVRIRGEKKQDHEEHRKNYYLTERVYGAFRRDIPLWTEVDADHIDAHFRKGVLCLRLPKAKETAASKRITVRST